jgi:hypothetical protein
MRTVLYGSRCRCVPPYHCRSTTYLTRVCSRQRGLRRHSRWGPDSAGFTVMLWAPVVRRCAACGGCCWAAAACPPAGPILVAGPRARIRATVGGCAARWRRHSGFKTVELSWRWWSRASDVRCRPSWAAPTSSRYAAAHAARGAGGRHAG